MAQATALIDGNNFYASCEQSLDPSLIGSRAVGVRDGAHVGPPAAAGELGGRRAEADVGPSSVVTGRRARLAHAIERLCQSLGRVLLVERRLWGKGTGGGRGGGSDRVGGGARFRGKTIGGFDAPCRHPPGRRGRRSPRPRRRRPYMGRRAAARVATPSRRGATLRFSQRRVPGEKPRVIISRLQFFGTDRDVLDRSHAPPADGSCTLRTASILAEFPDDDHTDTRDSRRYILV